MADRTETKYRSNVVLKRPYGATAILFAQEDARSEVGAEFARHNADYW